MQQQQVARGAGLPVVAGVEISTDAEGRFNLNALHRASGEAMSKKPSEWLRTKQSQDLICALESQSGDSRSGEKSGTCVNVVNGGNAPGTFAHELLAVSYAGWISPAFQLKVNQVFLDYRTGKFAPVVDPANLSRLQLIEIAMQAETERLQLAGKVETLAPKAAALDLLSTADGSVCITNAAKDLSVRPKELFDYLSGRKWIYRRPGGVGWVAYQDKLQAGLLEHKVTTVERSDGSEKMTEQVLVTPKGLAKLAEVFSLKGMVSNG